MKYQAEDIEVFVLSYNRAIYIEETIQSLLNQTMQGFDIIVLDNGSTDNTEEVVSRYYNKVQFVANSSNMGPEGNFKRAQTMASKKWVMVFHDDDLLHPKYIEVFLDMVNRNDRITLAVAGFIPTSSPSNSFWDLNNKISIIYITVTALAAKCYMGFSMAFSSAIYRTDLFKITNIQYNIYGKIFDRPFIFNAAATGEIAILKGCEIQYRIHPGQDSKGSVTGPFLDQTIALQKKYYELLHDGLLNKNGWVFLLNNYRHLRGEAIRLKMHTPELTVGQYINLALESKSATRKSIVIGRITFPVFTLIKMILMKKRGH